MNRTSRPRKDPRTAATQRQLIECAETLFGQHGADGVSLRQLAQAAGSSNTNVVAYHFGSKEALIRQIIHHRLPKLDARRAEILESLGERGEADSLDGMLEALMRPFLEQTNDEGHHSYIRFTWGLFRSNDKEILRSCLNSDYPVTRDLAERIRAALPEAAAARFDDRIQIVVGIVASALLVIDHLNCGPDRAEELFRDAVVMAKGALTASPAQ
jgi:AcrR family transcriptional regulator